MKKVILLPIILAFQFSIAQDDLVNYLNERGKPVKEKKASYLIQRSRLNDTSWEINTYKIFGPLLSSVQAKDEDGMIKNGRYISYVNGIRDSFGYYSNNSKENTWSTFTHDYNNRLIKQLEYKKGQLINEKDSNEINTINQKLIDSLKITNQDKNIEIESSFRDGQSGWIHYLLKNFRYPDRAIINNIQGRVIIQFMINNEGKIENAFVERSVEYSTDKESLRIINESGDWIPALKNGRKVKSYKRQPIDYKLQMQR